MLYIFSASYSVTISYEVLIHPEIAQIIILNFIALTFQYYLIFIVLF